MIGNSIKYILPVIDIKGHAIHIPYVTWEHEISNKNILSNRLKNSIIF